jgi:Mg2+ and Co2+ transporter CorA
LFSWRIRRQITIFLIDRTVISIQNYHSSVTEPLLDRILFKGSKLRLNGPAFLVHALVDGVVDELFPITRLLRQNVGANG